MKVSVIIPVLNEAEEIGGAISQLRGLPSNVSIEGKAEPDAGKAEIIVVDGGSADATPMIAGGLGVRVIASKRGRGAQMDAGAEASIGDVLLFLHADTRLPDNYLAAIRSALEGKEAVAGAFSLGIASDKARFRIIEYFANLRARAFGIIYGDQAIFARRDAFLSAGGFNKLPLMEDLDCVKRLRSLGRVILLKESARVSARRWEKGGVIRTTLKNYLFLALYFLGVPPDRIYKWYYHNPPAPDISVQGRPVGKGQRGF
ncbi:MAG: TIGR04283 family arsenosugar biosynthesis glycosyltransferase [Deltaproteobacteria bacterium]|nr:TIGR04283 family arsenosugar biosynthesis glycosyltransferase [Deltaproteobacteria bacterium]